MWNEYFIMDYDLKRSQNTVRFESAYKNIKIKK